MATQKNVGVRLSNVARPIYSSDTQPIIFANDALGGLHIVRSLAEFEKIEQRLMVGMEVVSLDESTFREDDGTVSPSGSPEVGRWRLVSAEITCNGNKINCPLFKGYGNNKCLFENPSCRITKIKNCKWKRLYDDPPPVVEHRWEEIIGIPDAVKKLGEGGYVEQIYARQITFQSAAVRTPTNLLSDDGKINASLLRSGTAKGVIFWNEKILVDHSFYSENNWTRETPEEVKNKTSLEIGEKVQQVNLALMESLQTVVIPDNGALRSFRLNNTKIKTLDLRNVNGTLEDLNLDNNTLLEEIWVSANDDEYTSNPDWRIPLRHLSVRNCGKLKKIHITGSQVTTIDLNDCSSLEKLYADNSPLVSVVCQKTYNGTEGYSHYFIRNNAMNEVAYENMYRSMYIATSSFKLCIHEGRSKYSRESDTTIATKLGHVISFDENQPLF